MEQDIFLHVRYCILKRTQKDCSSLWWTTLRGFTNGVSSCGICFQALSEEILVFITRGVWQVPFGFAAKIASSPGKEKTVKPTNCEEARPLWLNGDDCRATISNSFYNVFLSCHFSSCVFGEVKIAEPGWSQCFFVFNWLGPRNTLSVLHCF